MVGPLNNAASQQQSVNNAYQQRPDNRIREEEQKQQEKRTQTARAGDVENNSQDFGKTQVFSTIGRDSESSSDQRKERSEGSERGSLVDITV